jgi:hypothetical protein
MSNWVNCGCQVLLGYGALMDLVMGILRLVGKPLDFVVIIIVVVVFAIVGGAVFAYDSVSHKHLEAFFAAFEENPPMTDEEAFERFDTLRLNRSSKRALFYLDSAITCHFMRFYDFSYMKYIHLHFREPSVIIHCSRVISWLPYCARPLNFLCSEATTRRDIHLEDRFVLFQLERIRLLRESSASTTAAEKLTSVKTYSAETAGMIRAFWERSECNIALLNRFVRQLAGADSIWHEAIEDFPNSVQFRDVYITYLIESASRFSDAVFQKSRVDMIENGVDFRVDNCYRRFVRHFPDYVKRSILDLKGNLIKRVPGGKSSHAAGTSHDDLSGVLDIGMEEGIGRAILTQARVRLTVERAFVGRRPNAFGPMVVATFVTLGICIGTFIFVDAFFASYFDARGDVADRIAHQNFARFYLISSLYAWFYYWGTDPAISILDTGFLAEVEAEDGDSDLTPFFQPDTSWDDRAMFFNVEGRLNYQTLMISVMAMATANVDIFTYAGPLFDTSAMQVRFCTEIGRAHV